MPKNAPPSKKPVPASAVPMTEDEQKKLAELAREQAHKVMKQIPVLGAVSWLMMQQAATRHTLLSELEWRVMPPLVLNQAKLFLREEAPLAYVSWAKLSEAAAARFQQTPHHLMASDWQSGEQIWLIDLCAPFGGAQDVLKDLRENTFAGQRIFQLAPRPDGDIQVVTWPPTGEVGGG